MSDDDVNDPKPAYAIGYGKPPVAHRFQPGRSGNPKGRPRQRQSMAAVFREMLMSKTTTVSNGKRRRMTTIEIAAMRTKKEIITGSPRTLERLLAVIERFAPTCEAMSEEFFIDYESLTEEQLRALASIKTKLRTS